MRPEVLNETKIQELLRVLSTTVNWVYLEEIASLIKKIRYPSLAQEVFKKCFHVIYRTFGTEDNRWYNACQVVMKQSSVMAG